MEEYVLGFLALVVFVYLVALGIVAIDASVVCTRAEYPYYKATMGLKGYCHEPGGDGTWIVLPKWYVKGQFRMEAD